MSAQEKREKKATISDWSDIHFAYQVARTGTLSAAAEILGVHHSTVLRRISALEKRLNARLFQRHPRGYTPTDAGQLLLSTASRTQEEFDRLIGLFAGSNNQLAGTIIITTVSTFSAQLTPILAEFQQRYPDIRLEYLVDEHIYKLEYGEAHVSLRYGAKPTEPDYVVQELRKLKVTLYASPAYIARHGDMKDMNDIRGHRFISPTKNFSNVPFLSWLYQVVPPEQIYYRTTDFNSMLCAVEAGLGIAPIECWTQENRHMLKPLFAPPDAWDTNLWIATHRDVHRTPKLQALTRFLKKALANSYDKPLVIK